MSTMSGYPTLMIKTSKSIYRGYRFPAEVIEHAVWLYFRFPLSLRMIEDLLAGARDHHQPRDRAVLGGGIRTDLRQQNPPASASIRRLHGDWRCGRRSGSFASDL
jgi:hypothetical protein